MFCIRTESDPTMTDAFICDALRTPFGRYGGALASVRARASGSRAMAIPSAFHRSFAGSCFASSRARS